MRNRLAFVAAVSTIFLTLALSPASRAQQENPQPAGAGAQNAAANQDKIQASVATETIRGVIAGITAEGEAMFDFRNNRAVAAEGAFLTIVGSPRKADGEATRAAAAATEERGSANRKRHNVYYVWMTPKTKICEGWAQPEKSNAQTDTQRSDQKREVAFDNLEVGDHVEIQFALRDDTTSTGSAHQTEQMRRKHGRQRTYVGYATEVTILPAKDAAAHGAEGDNKEKRGSQ
jgi:hypothetical protein